MGHLPCVYVASYEMEKAEAEAEECQIHSIYCSLSSLALEVIIESVFF
jgi:hypothetical protein